MAHGVSEQPVASSMHASHMTGFSMHNWPQVQISETHSALLLTLSVTDTLSPPQCAETLQEPPKGSQGKLTCHMNT